MKIFPTAPGELPEGLNPHRDALCHCALASIYQVLAAGGLEVERELPWAKPWFLRYQMADGGLTCDNDAYRVTGECPSSMVGTVSPLEAMLLGDPAAWSAEQVSFVDRAAGFLVGRELRRGSSSVHNAEERAMEPAWLQPCFPRFYFYDVLRGARALVRWAELREATLPLASVEAVATHLCEAFPDGIVRTQRQAHAGRQTWAQDAAGAWARQPASRFALLDVTSVPGEPSPWLTREWTETRQGLLRLLEAGRLVERPWPKEAQPSHLALSAWCHNAERGVEDARGRNTPRTGPGRELNGFSKVSRGVARDGAAPGGKPGRDGPGSSEPSARGRCPHATLRGDTAGSFHTYGAPSGATRAQRECPLSSLARRDAA